MWENHFSSALITKYAKYGVIFPDWQPGPE
jgi:hypothetical protein